MDDSVALVVEAGQHDGAGPVLATLFGAGGGLVAPEMGVGETRPGAGFGSVTAYARSLRL